MVAVSGYRFVRYNGTDWCDALVPIRPLQWYRLVRCVGTDSSATVVPIGAKRWYRFIRYSGTDSPILSETTEEDYSMVAEPIESYGSNNIVVFLTIQYYFLSLRHE